MAGDDFRLAFHHVERRAVGFGDAGHPVHDEQREQRQEEPVEQTRIALLRQHDVGQVQAAGGDHHANQREAHRDFVADHLCGRTHRTEERVLGVGRPTGQDHAVHTQRGHRQQVQQADVGVGQHQLVIKRNHRPRRERRCQHDQRRDDVHRLVCAGRSNDFLEQQLGDVRECLQQTTQADVHRPVANVHPADQLALPQHVERNGNDHRHGDGQDFQHRPQHNADIAQ
ncbi:hypothetical protein D3C71_1155080 [compost metagenome]